MPKALTVFTILHAGDTVQSPNGTNFRVYYVGIEKAYLERDITVRDITGWFKPFGCCFESIAIAGLRQGERIRREGHTGEFVVKNVIYKECAFIATEYIELTDPTGWTFVTPG